MNFEEILSFDTNLTADVVEWKNDDSNLLACGTYYLDKEKNQRLGILYILELDELNKNFKVNYTLNYDNSGILDLKWLDQENLITIDSDNNLKIIDYKNSLNTIGNINLNRDSIGLSLDFIKQNNQYEILSTDTLGYLTLVCLDEKFYVKKSFKGHDYEVWSNLIDKNDSNIIYSGADDCLLRMWDLREPEHKKANECNIFEGGVCSIILPQRNDDLTCLPNYTNNNILCGSYDERIYVLDKRNMKRAINQSKKLDGGVWKMKLHAQKDLLLCACMHTGLHIVDSQTLTSNLYYDKHGLNNLAYGCDWKSSKKPEFDIIASCSFYNHELRIWKINYL